MAKEATKVKQDTGDAYKVLIKPLLTEKVNKMASHNVVAFKVHKDANKIMVANAISKVYNVKVERVNMVTMPSKIRSFGRSSGRVAAWKKAIVTLKKGEVIS